MELPGWLAKGLIKAYILYRLERKLFHRKILYTERSPGGEYSPALIDSFYKKNFPDGIEDWTEFNDKLTEEYGG